ncbi:carboxypeptidase-like regulatory domain-containing protein [Aureibaculum sp. A20]|uniref:Carboxypeptidase-like regulatory domain-containing protein n=1 Tax=Aureibaculum flavum TaxID=2795986 RepID=A0ABS0WT60_9FLAO|nr:carboxypeptidase-like regulatory domain-containing protein [Aureibaculum flavum]MBJ2175135.1 carboxypeptidase-like regulatory domain-containing protein [Aureibaculum flavum]
MKNVLLLLLLVTINSYGQQIKGVVLDQISNKPLENVNVYIKNIEKGTTTSNQGEFFIESNKSFNKNDSISFSYVGYFTANYSLGSFSNGKVTIHLKRNTEQLNEVNISVERKLKYSLEFNELTSVNNGIHSFGSVLVNGKIYIIGGDKSYLMNQSLRALEMENPGRLFKDINASFEKYDSNLKIYDIEKDEWTYPELQFRERAYHNLNYFEGKIYIHGGKRLSRNRKLEYLDDKIERFDIKTNEILIDNSNPHQAINAASFVFDNKLIVLGGSTKVKTSGTKIYSNKTHVYSSESGYWYELNDMLLGKETKGVLVKNNYYLFGGYKDNVLNAVETLDLISGKWKEVGKLFERMERPGLATDGSVIYIFDDNVFATYNTETKQLNQYHINLRLKSPEMYYYKNKLYILGGSVPSNFSKLSSPKVFSIDLKDLESTKINKYKKFDY